MNVDAFLDHIRSHPAYRGQIVHVHEMPAEPARYAPGAAGLSEAAWQALHGLGVGRLYSHQAEAVREALAGGDVLVCTGTASGKSLCYLAPIIEMLRTNPGGRALLLFPTKALCQDQFRKFSAALKSTGRRDVPAGVFDGDTPSATRRKLRDHAAVVFSNPDMLHAAMLPQHTRWAGFIANLRYLVLDELHVYSGIFGANMANLLRRLERVCEHYGSRPQIIAGTATIANPVELFERLTGRRPVLIDRDGSPRGRRVFVLWNPPVERNRVWRSRRSANVEAHELMAELVRRGCPTIVFSKAKMTAEMIHRYVSEALRESAPQLVKKVTPYRGGYRPEERREIERRLFEGELLGVSTTRALELGIDVGALDACIIIGYPGTLASFLQQAGRAGRGDRDSLVVLIGLDTSVNQYIMSHPEYLFERAVEQAVVDPDNPFVIIGHLRCAAHEIALPAGEARRFGPFAELVLRLLEENHKLRNIDGTWYHAATETPQHEFTLRDTVDANVLIEDAATGQVLGEVNKLDAPPILHPEAIYMHRGDTYRVLKLDLDRNVATVKREEVDYYTQPLGGTDVHHIDACLREKPFGTGRACWGEVTAYFRTHMFEKVRFYELDAISRHGLELPTFVLETMAVWLVPPEELMSRVRNAGLDAHAGLRGIGYATRMLLPLFITCDTLDFSHSVGSVNSPWNAIFIYERYRLGLGYTKRAYELLGEIMPAVRDNIHHCPCEDGCPCCVGKPLRQYSTWDVQRGEGSIPSKRAALMILDGLLGDGTNLHCPDSLALSDARQAEAMRLEQALRRRLERGREPEVFHPIKPKVETAYPKTEKAEQLDVPDVQRRIERKRDFHRNLRARLAGKLASAGLDPLAAPRPPLPPGMSRRGGNLTPKHFPGKPKPQPAPGPESTDEKPGTIHLGNRLASRAGKLTKRRSQNDRPTAQDRPGDT